MFGGSIKGLTSEFRKLPCVLPLDLLPPSSPPHSHTQLKITQPTKQHASPQHHCHHCVLFYSFCHRCRRHSPSQVAPQPTHPQPTLTDPAHSSSSIHPPPALHHEHGLCLGYQQST